MNKTKNAIIGALLVLGFVAANARTANAGGGALFGAFNIANLDIGLRVTSRQVYTYKAAWLQKTATEMASLPRITEYSRILTPELVQRMMVLMLTRQLLQQTPSEIVATRILPQVDQSTRMLTKKFRIGYVGNAGPEFATIDNLPRDPQSQLFALKLCHPTLVAIHDAIADSSDEHEYAALIEALGRTLAAANASPGIIEPFWSEMKSTAAFEWRARLLQNPRTKPFVEMLMALSRYLEPKR